ncbi:serine protease 55-like [Pectinophora gossypiella]|uniref:serine protease 55-like n=1 Tax=Pectinophora gossypiella TaxID=13191 RepID=UPI00214EFBDC|nr:serine protease 55-like [Pectinophora gossypiella]
MIRIVAGSLANEVTEMKNGNNISDPAVQWRGIKRIFVHNEFNFPINDIALLIVDNPWKFDHSVHSVQVAKEGEDNWANCIVAGYGRVSHDSKAPSSPTLLLAYINILSKNNCSTLWEINMDKFVCSDSVVSSDVAKGDSGGPLVCDGQSKASLFPENERLVGVICGKNFDKTTLFTRVSGYSEFITRLRASSVETSSAVVKVKHHRRHQKNNQSDCSKGLVQQSTVFAFAVVLLHGPATSPACPAQTPAHPRHAPTPRACAPAPRVRAHAARQHPAILLHCTAFAALTFIC